MAHYYFENRPHGKRRDGSKLNTRAHYEYICREGKYLHIAGREEDLVYASSGNMPSWADTPSDFWHEAELHRRKNGRAYREFRFALQEEFTLAENVELVERLMDEFGIKENHVYCYVIHDKKATFDKKHRNVHCHLMFNEKILEKDRPLPVETFFKQYSVDRAGNPSSGYRTSAYFDQKEATLALRRRWAELCNEKFAEKRLDSRISEKTLNDQRQELLAQGKDEEAALLDRIPAPHLGTAYRNPRTMERIMEEAETADKAAEEYTGEHEEKFDGFPPQEWENLPLPDAFDEDTAEALLGQESQDFGEPTAEEMKEASEPTQAQMRRGREQKILLFANDLAIRRVARKIQQERLRLARLQKGRDEAQLAHEILNDPLVVTSGDVLDFMDEERQEIQAQAAAKLTAYQEQKVKLLDASKIHAAAIDRAFEGRYSSACSEYANLGRQIEALKPKTEALYGHTDIESVRRLAELLRQSQEMEQQRKAYGREIGICKHKMAGEYREKIAAIEQELAKENAERQQGCNRLYAEYKNLQKRLAEYDATIQSLTIKGRDEILFSDKLPRMLTRYCKIDGLEPVGKCRTLVLDGNSYALLQKLPPMEKLPHDGTFSLDVPAVRIGDDIQRGKVPKYLLHISLSGRRRWKIRSVRPALTQEQKPDVVCLYPVHARKQKPAAISRPMPPKVQEAYRQRRQAKIIQISSLAKNLLPQEKDTRLDAHWSEKSGVQDKAMRDEEKLYMGWGR